MAEPTDVFRIHPAIGIARVGNSEEHYLGPETMAGLGPRGSIVGGLPIRPGTESATIDSSELRDRSGAMKRQAARFKIYRYSAEAAGSQLASHRFRDPGKRHRREERFSPEQFLEVESLLGEPEITPWPMYSKNLDS